MSEMQNNRNLSAAIALGIALVVCAAIFSWVALDIKSKNQSLSVTGAAYKPIKSDFAVWEGNLTTSSPDLQAAYAKLENDRKLLVSFLTKQGWDSTQYRINGVQLYKRRNREGVLVSHDLSQSVTVESPEIDRVSRLSKEVSSLIENGVEIQSQPPRYLFTKLDDAKLEMIHLATLNARERAEQLASAADTKVGALTSARVGVFQIRPQHSQSVSDYGMSDVTSIDKEIVSTVHATFSVE